jgi:heme/copper-type cytochrome/quinol oxidase subunit 1
MTPFWRVYRDLFIALAAGWLALFFIVQPAVEYFQGIEAGRLVARISVAAFLGLVAMSGAALVLRILGLTPKTEESSHKYNQLIKPGDRVVMMIVMAVVLVAAAAIFALVPDIANNRRLMNMLISVIPGALLLTSWLALMIVMRRRKSRLQKEKDGF